MLDRDLNDIAVFAKVVEARSFTGAGKQLGMPRSTVSRRIAELERRLGARLLHRTTRKLRLTDVGSRYYERCAKGLTAIDEAEACVRATSDVPRGRIRMTAPHAMDAQLGPTLTAFLRTYPEVSVEVELAQRMVDLVGEGFDLAIRATGHLPDSTLVARQLSSGDASLWASEAYLASHPPVTKPQDLAEHDIVSFGPLTRSWTLIQGDDTPIEVAINPRLTVNGPSLAISAASAGFGIAMLPFDPRRNADRSGLRPVLPDYRGFRGTLYLVYPSAKLMSATLRALIDHLVDYFSRELN